MGDTTQNIPIPAGQWVDLYALSGITVGTQIRVENTGVNDVLLAVSPTQPAADSREFNILQRGNGVRMINSPGDSGAWARCNNDGAEVNVSPIRGVGFFPSFDVQQVMSDGDSPAIDAFARNRVSDPFTLFDSRMLYDKQPLFWDEVVAGAATSAHVLADAMVQMDLTASASDYVIRQTKRRFNYQPGKSQLIFMTFRAPQSAGVRTRVGPFSGTGVNNLTPDNGIFMEVSAGDVSLNIAKNGVVTETTTQANWSVDPFNGMGPSGIDLDMSAPQILVIDYAWLGIGRVRIGFLIGGVIHYAHYFNHANDPSFGSVYMRTPNLPLRYSLETDGSAAARLEQICSTVIVEGEVERTGVKRAVESGAGFITSLSLATKYAMLGLRLKATHLDATVIPTDVTVLTNTNDAFKWEYHLNPVVAGTFTYGDLANSAVQFAQGNSLTLVTTPGIVVAAGGTTTLLRKATEDLVSALRMGSTIAGVRDELVLVVEPFSANMSAWGTVTFRELL